MSRRELTIEAELESLQLETFGYFLHETNPVNGLLLDKTAPDWPASIAATGLALPVYPVAVERGFITRATAIERILATLRFSSTASKAPSRTLPATMVFTIIFSTCRQGGARGNANCRPWTAPFCSPVR